MAKALRVGRKAQQRGGLCSWVWFGSIIHVACAVVACGGSESDPDAGMPTDGGSANVVDAAGVDACAAATPGPGTHFVQFDEYSDAMSISAEYATLGVVFESQGSPSISTMFSSPVSAPGFLSGEYEGAQDLNPGLEFGNNQPALAVTARFVSTMDGSTPAVTDFVSLREVYSNTGNVTRLEAFDLMGSLVASDQVVGDSAAPGKLLSVSGTNIHYVVVTFEAPGSNGIFEDNAGIDDLRFTRPARACQ